MQGAPIKTENVKHLEGTGLVLSPWNLTAKGEEKPKIFL